MSLTCPLCMSQAQPDITTDKSGVTFHRVLCTCGANCRWYTAAEEALEEWIRLTRTARTGVISPNDHTRYGDCLRVRLRPSYKGDSEWACWIEVPGNYNDWNLAVGYGHSPDVAFDSAVAALDEESISLIRAILGRRK